ncbi:hypothetical protein JCM21900_003896 [Sporobolomyces salmonicolor]
MSSNPNGNAGNVWFGPPANYTEPSWPGLYDPLNGNTARYLYTPEQMWRFTLYDTLVLVGCVYFAGGVLCALNFSHRHFRLALCAPVVWSALGLTLALVGSTIVGYCLAALYNAAFLRMSTFVPALWSLVITLILILSSSTIQTMYTMG